MKDWILHNWKIFPYLLALTFFAVGVILVNERIYEKNPEHLRVEKRCLELVRKIEGIELDPREATLAPVGVTAKHASYSGILMVWEKETSGISVKCSIVSDGNRVRLFAVNGEDKTNLVGREAREK